LLAVGAFEFHIVNLPELSLDFKHPEAAFLKDDTPQSRGKIRDPALLPFDCLKLVEVASAAQK
jgi:hypothetical protein